MLSTPVLFGPNGDLSGREPWDDERFRRLAADRPERHAGHVPASTPRVAASVSGTEARPGVVDGPGPALPGSATLPDRGSTAGTGVRLAHAPGYLVARWPNAAAA
jgi:hypothetical protein